MDAKAFPRPSWPPQPASAPQPFTGGGLQKKPCCSTPFLKQMLPFGQHKSPLARLRKHVVEAARFLTSEHGRVMARLIMAIQEDDELRQGFLQIYYLPRRAAAHAVINEAIRRGELPSDTDPEVLIDALYGPLYARLFLGHAPLDEKFAEKIFDLLI
jgi:hypothetical protein